MAFVCIFLPASSPWYNCTGWLGVKHQLTYLLPASQGWYEPLPVSFSLLHKYADTDHVMLNHYLHLSLYITRTMLNHYQHLSFYKYDYTGVEPLSASFSLQVWWHWCWSTSCIFLSASMMTLMLKYYLHLSLDLIRMMLNHYLTSVTILMLNHYLHISPCKYNDTYVELPSASFSPGWCWTLPASFINQA